MGDTEDLRGNMTMTQEWYDILLKSEIILAEKDMREIKFLMEVEITLASGEILIGEYAPGSGALQIGEYRFYNERFSEIF